MASPDPANRQLSIGIFVLIVSIAFEFMAVATALPVAARELSGLYLYPWALTGFLGASMFANAIGGELCDRLGPKRPLVAGAALFAGGLVVSGTATSMPVLILGRVIQGTGAGLIIVAVYVVIALCYSDLARPRTMSLIATAWVVPSVVGPFIAGGLTEHVSWRWAFLSIAPLVPIPLLMILPKLGSARASGEARESRVWPAIAIAVGAAALQWAGLEAEKSHWVLAAVGLGLGVTAVAVATARLFPAGTFRLRRGLPSVVAFRGVTAGGFFGCQAYVPLMLVQHRGLTPTLAGLSVAGTAIGWSAGAWWQGRPALAGRRAGLVAVGAMVTAASVVVVAGAAIVTDTVTLPAWLAGVGLAIGGLGMGLSMASNSVLLFDMSRPEDQGTNSAALQMSDGLGGLVVIGGAGAVYAILSKSQPETLVFTVVFGLAFVVMLLSIAVGFRVRPAAASPAAEPEHHARVV